MCSLSVVAAMNRTILLASNASNHRWLYTCGVVFYLLSVLKPTFFLQSLFLYAFTLFLGDDRGLQCFGPVRVFHDEEHSAESSVLEISSSGNVVHEESILSGLCFWL